MHLLCRRPHVQHWERLSAALRHTVLAHMAFTAGAGQKVTEEAKLSPHSELPHDPVNCSEAREQCSNELFFTQP